MKKTLLFIALIATSSFFAQTELVLNGTADDFIYPATENGNTKNVDDNADAWDMTPNSKVIDNSGATVDSPYAAIWKNQTLEDALEAKYFPGIENPSLDEQPGSTSSGRDGTRGVKLYDDGGQGDDFIGGSSRRLYQLVQGLTIGKTYNFSIDSNSESVGTPSEVYILNNEITDENGIDANGFADSSVVTGVNITNDEGAWTTTTFSFVATTTEVVIYVRALGANSKENEVFYDNISLKEAATASTQDVFAANFSVYPNPANDVLNITSVNKVEKAEIFSLIGKRVVSTTSLTNNSIDISSLAKGVYILKLVSGDVVGTRKIIKE